MKKSIEVQFCTDLFFYLPKEEKIRIITTSNLYEKESELLIYRYVEGRTIKETSEIMNIEYDAFIKAQRKILNKLYCFIHKNPDKAQYFYEIIK